MKKRHFLLAAALALVIGLCFWLLSANGICIGRIEQRSDDQWSQLHVYMNDEITVNFPIHGTPRTCLFQYETGRGSFTAKITDAEGNILYSDSTSESGSAAFQAGSDLKLWIKGEGHGGTFSLLQREEPILQPGDDPTINGLQLEGSHTGGQFTATYDLLRIDGKYVNFYVENRGNGPVTISINGENNRTINAGDYGHVTVSISSTVMPQPMTVKCVSASGDDIDIYWKVAQRAKN